MRPGARRAAVIAIVLAVVAGVWLIVWPCSYRGSRPGSSEETLCASLIAVNGTWVVGLLAVPIGLTVLGYVALVARLRPVVWIVAVLLLALNMVGAASIGLFYMPSAIALFAAIGISRKGAEAGSARQHASADDR